MKAYILAGAILLGLMSVFAYTSFVPVAIADNGN